MCPYYLLYLLVEYYLYVCDPFRYKKSTLVTPLGTNSDVSCDPFRYRKTPQNHRATVQKSPHPSLFFGEINGLDGARINAPLAVE